MILKKKKKKQPFEKSFDVTQTKVLLLSHFHRDKWNIRELKISTISKLSGI